MVSKRKELVAKLQQVRKEHNNAYVLAREITKLLSMNHTMVVTEKSVEHLKEIDPTWLKALEWMITIYDDYVKDINKMLEKYFEDLVKIK